MLSKLFTYGPMSVFAYQVYLAFTGRNPLSVYSYLPDGMFYYLAHTLKIVFA